MCEWCDPFEPDFENHLAPMAALREWHRAFGQQGFFDEEDRESREFLVKQRMTLIEEEFDEVMTELRYFVERPEKARLENLMKELADLLYVTYGTAEVFDSDLDAVFQLVHRNNMTKVNKELGQIKFREDGKVLKPEGYKKLTPEDIRRVM